MVNQYRSEQVILAIEKLNELLRFKMIEDSNPQRWAEAGLKPTQPALDMLHDLFLEHEDEYSLATLTRHGVPAISFWFSQYRTDMDIEMIQELLDEGKEYVLDLAGFGMTNDLVSRRVVHLERELQIAQEQQLLQREFALIEREIALINRQLAN